MVTLIALLGFLLLLTLAAADVMVSDISSEEQVRMGVQH